MLAKQRAAIQNSEGENYIYTDVDVLGPSIARLLKRAAQSPIEITQRPPEEPEATIKGELWPKALDRSAGVQHKIRRLPASPNHHKAIPTNVGQCRFIWGSRRIFDHHPLF